MPYQTTGRDYDIAQICTNGHVVNANSIRFPEDNQNFCSKCGASTSTECQYCDTPIRGRHMHGPSHRRYRVPLYCHECSKPYPWTDALIKAAHELTDMADNLTDEERNNLKEDIDDLISNAPRVQAASIRANALATKAGIKDALISIFSNIASDTLAKVIRGW